MSETVAGFLLHVFQRQQQDSTVTCAVGRLENGQTFAFYEADLNHSLHYLINRGLRGSVGIGGSWRAGEGIDRVYNNPHLEPNDWEPELAVLVLDIETHIETDEVFAVSLVGTGPREGQRFEEIHLVGEEREDDPSHLFCHADEKTFLQALNARVRQIDPDVLSGWNVIDFDLTVLERRCKVHGVDFNLGRTRDSSWLSGGQDLGWQPHGGLRPPGARRPAFDPGYAPAF